MFKYVLLFIFPSIIFAQDSKDNLGSDLIENNEIIEEEILHKYVSLIDNKVYDIEIIVFAYQQELPNYKTFTNKEWFDDSQSLELKLKPEDLSFIQEDLESIETTDDTTVDNTQPVLVDNNQTESDYTVSIVDETEEKYVLAWFEHDPEFYQLTPIWERLLRQPSITPLIHKAWRQPDTPFEQPTYVKLNNFPVEDLDESIDDGVNGENNESTSINTDYFTNSIDNNFDNDDYYPEVNTTESSNNPYSDLTVSGMVALSQGRFMHFGHSLNLVRHYTDDNNELRTMVFSLTERKQLKPDELHYYDSPWFGSIVKITEYLGEEENENSEDNENND